MDLMTWDALRRWLSQPRSLPIDETVRKPCRLPEPLFDLFGTGLPPYRPRKRTPRPEATWDDLGDWYRVPGEPL